MELDKQLGSLLLKSGLSEVDTCLYLSLLKKPVVTKWQLLLNTGLGKNKVYRSFEKLEQLKLVKKTRQGLQAASLQSLIDNLNSQNSNNISLISQLKQVQPLLSIPSAAVSAINLASTREQILENYHEMSLIPYETCLDFGDLEGFVGVLGGMDPVFQFRKQRFKKKAKNLAICTTTGPYTSCMARKRDMKKFKSNIKKNNLKFRGKWIIFSDSNDQIMFNDFSDPSTPSSLTIKSKLLAEHQRLLFAQF